MIMKRYVLFAWQPTTIHRGWKSTFVDTFDSIDEAKAHPRWIEARKFFPYAWIFTAEIVDLQTGESEPTS